MIIRITHLGTATVILEIGSLRLITDPALDPAGKHYDFAFGTGSTKTQSPALPPEGLGAFDAALVSHHQHADNLDPAGLELLARIPKTLSTRKAGSDLPKILKGSTVVGLEPWQVQVLTKPGAPPVRVTATPARHGPPLSLPVVGPVIGFALEWEGQRHGALYISGDTVWFPGIAEVARRFKVSAALIHVGGVRFGISGPVRYTFDGPAAARTAAACGARTIIPIHYEGWTHFAESRSATTKAFDRAELGPRVVWLERGKTAEVDV